jgi:hypothetical protein
MAGLELENIFGKNVNLIKIIFPSYLNNFNTDSRDRESTPKITIIKGLSTAELQIGGGNTWNRPGLNSMDMLNNFYQMYNTFIGDVKFSGKNFFSKGLKDIQGTLGGLIETARTEYGVGKNFQMRSTTKAIYGTSEIPSFGVTFLLVNYRHDMNILEDVMKLQSAVLPEPGSDDLNLLNLPLESSTVGPDGKSDVSYPFFTLKLGNYFMAYKLLFEKFDATLSQQEVRVTVNGEEKLVPLFASCQAVFTVSEQVDIETYRSFFSKGVTL